MIEEELSQGVISTLHAQEYDDFEYTYSEEGYTAKNLEEIFATFESRGQIKKIICGKRHTTILTGRQEGEGGADELHLNMQILLVKLSK